MAKKLEFDDILDSDVSVGKKILMTVVWSLTKWWGILLIVMGVIWVVGLFNSGGESSNDQGSNSFAGSTWTLKSASDDDTKTYELKLYNDGTASFSGRGMNEGTWSKKSGSNADRKFDWIELNISGMGTIYMDVSSDNTCALYLSMGMDAIERLRSHAIMPANFSGKRTN